MFEHLNLKEWPFRTTADEAFASVWAGRGKTRQQIDRLIRKMQMYPSSGMHILWANFGMGKTHTLYHIRYRCQSIKTTPLLIPVYAVMPKRSTGFLELYREIVQGLPYDFLHQQIQKIGSATRGSVVHAPMFSRSPGVVKALLAINSEDIEMNTTAKRWLAAQKGLSKSDLNLLGISYQIKTPEDGINALSALTSLACYDQDPSKQNQLVVMVDEYQQVGELKPKILAENHSSLHAYFNQHPTGLQIILSFSVGKKENVDFLLSAELKSRAEPQSLNLDVLTEEDACEFIRDLFAQFRFVKDDRWAFPFHPDAVSGIIQKIKGKKALTPRRLMLYFNHILKEVSLDQEPGEEGYTFEDIQKHLNDPQLGDLDKDHTNE